MMESRFLNLHNVAEGLSKTNIPLISWNGMELTPFLGYDDIGIYVLIPKLAKLLNVSLPVAINLFFYSIFLGSLTLALIGFFLWNKSPVMRSIILLEIVLLTLPIHYLIHDVYSAHFAANLGFIPLFLYFINKKNTSYIFYLFMFCAGLSLGMLHYIRSYSSIGVFLFMLIMLTLNSFLSLQKKIIFISLLFLGSIVPVGYFHRVINNYESYCKNRLESTMDLPTEHPFWHPIYLGFGFLNLHNKDKIEWSDTCGELKVKSINPEIDIKQFTAYETILKEETYTLLKTQPLFVLFTIFSKIGILLFYFLFFANIGCIAFCIRSKQWVTELAFLSALSINALFPLLAVPFCSYSLGFICVATIYGLYSIQQAFSTEAIKNISTLFKRKISKNIILQRE